MKTQEVYTKSIKLDQLDIERLNVIAGYKKRTPHYLMKEAIKEFINQQEARIKFILEAEQSAQHFEATGLHISLEELDNWTNDVEQNSNESTLKCHK